MDCGGTGGRIDQGLTCMANSLTRGGGPRHAGPSALCARFYCELDRTSCRQQRLQGGPRQIHATPGIACERVREAVGLIVVECGCKKANVAKVFDFECLAMRLLGGEAGIKEQLALKDQPAVGNNLDQPALEQAGDAVRGQVSDLVTRPPRGLNPSATEVLLRHIWVGQ